LKLPATTIVSSTNISLWCSLRRILKTPVRRGTNSSMFEWIIVFVAAQSWAA
jgi:hypothetical protein